MRMSLLVAFEGISDGPIVVARIGDHQIARDALSRAHQRAILRAQLPTLPECLRVEIGREATELGELLEVL